MNPDHPVGVMGDNSQLEESKHHGNKHKQGESMFNRVNEELTSQKQEQQSKSPLWTSKPAALSE